MGLVRDILIYLTREEIAKQSNDLQQTDGSSRGYFPDLQLWPLFQTNKFVETDQVGDSVSHSLEIILCINM